MVQTSLFLAKFDILSPPVTLKIRSRSPKLNHFFLLSDDISMLKSGQNSPKGLVDCFLVEISGIIHSLFRGRQNIFLTIFSTKFDLKVATKILIIALQIQKLWPKIFLYRQFSMEKNQGRDVIIFPENLKNLNILSQFVAQNAT